MTVSGGQHDAAAGNLVLLTQHGLSHQKLSIANFCYYMCRSVTLAGEARKYIFKNCKAHVDTFYLKPMCTKSGPEVDWECTRIGPGVPEVDWKWTRSVPELDQEYRK